MPITTSAKKALRSSKRKHVFNMRKKSEIQKAVKEVKKLLVGKNAKEAEAMMPKVQKILDKAAKTGYIKKNAASRKKSRIVAMIKKSK
jgi:small subunit ribosomal protein S20